MENPCLAARQDAFVAAARHVVPEATLLHRYQMVLGGVALRVPASAVDTIAALPGVVAVYRDTLLHPETDHRGPWVTTVAASTAFESPPHVTIALTGTATTAGTPATGASDASNPTASTGASEAPKPAVSTGASEVPKATARTIPIRAQAVLVELLALTKRRR